MTLQEFLNSLKGKTVAFCGIARTNIPVMELFYSKGAKIVARDINTNQSAAQDILKKVEAKLILGENYLDDLNEDMVFRAPGIPFTLPQFQDAIKRGVNVTSELELFLEYCPCKIFAVTGSDGKTTTTSMIAEMLKVDGNRVHLGGNIGRALFPTIEDISPYDVAVVELSSFQLISMTKSPDVAVITNITPNHLDVHKNMKEYVDAKRNIFLNQKEKSRLVLNIDNDITSSFSSEAKCEVWEFSRENEVQQGMYEKNGIIYQLGKPFIRSDEIKLQGGHNVENFMAAACAVYGTVSNESIIAVAKTFGGVAHRTEFVREFLGVKYYNDSIASSPTRVIKGTLSMYDQKIILIVGGADKKVPFDELGEIICDKVKALIVIKPIEQIEGFKPSAADKISTAVMGAKYYCIGHPLIIRVATMDDAVKAAREVSVSGDIVSLSPACTAFDMYKDFEVRGNHYKEIVMKLHEFENEK